MLELGTSLGITDASALPLGASLGWLDGRVLVLGMLLGTDDASIFDPVGVGVATRVDGA